ncbi:MAG: DegQ family serine endoprotease [Gallionella sp.]
MEVNENTAKYVLATVVLSLILAGGYTAYGYRETSVIPVAVAAVNETPSARKPIITLPDFAEIAAQQGAAVVNISVSGSAPSGMQGFPGFPQVDPNDPFYDFFRRFQMPSQPQGKTPTHGMGSGFIVSSDGVIITNAHVIADAEEVIVKLTDKREFKAKVKGQDKFSDVAVLKIDAKDLPVVKIGNPQAARVGEWVIAIGSPFGFENTVTAGIISAKSRSLEDEGNVPFLQTDVAVNPGNSGGPLLNTSGEVIGINSQIFSRSGGYQGLSFAIPIDVAMKVEKQLLDHGKVSRGRLGVMIQEVNQGLADTFGLDKPTGALVSSVEEGSPADKAGIEAGDVILKFNGKEISRSSELPSIVADVAPGSSANITLWRKGKTKDITLNVGERVASESGKAGGQEKSDLGLAARPLTAEERKQAGVSEGLLVQQVGDGPAAKAGIRPGDIILSVNSEKISSVKQLNALINKNGKRSALLILRGEQKLFVPFSLE